MQNIDVFIVQDRKRAKADQEGINWLRITVSRLQVCTLVSSAS